MKIKRSVKITLPIPMPTWNRILSMHHYERMSLRNLIHLFVKDAIEGRESCKAKLAEYMNLIRPSKKNKDAMKLARAESARKPKTSHCSAKTRPAQAAFQSDVAGAKQSRTGGRTKKEPKSTGSGGKKEEGTNRPSTKICSRARSGKTITQDSC